MSSTWQLSHPAIGPVQRPALHNKQFIDQPARLSYNLPNLESVPVPPVSEEEILIGQTIDNRYRIESLLGRGGMGAVYRATDLIDDQHVALKLLHFFLDLESQAAHTRFQREFRVLARLDHPNVMRAYRFGRHQEVPYLALEYLPGITLTEALRFGPLPRERLLDIAQQLCQALVYLHGQAIVHRDLKPGNLMLVPMDENPRVKLMDFGLVRPAELSRQLTQEGMALGTVAYMAPEQAQALPVDFRADLYALGIILYEMATGRTPFVHDNPAVLLMQQLTAIPPPPRQFNPELDQPLEQLILDLLAREPAQRPDSSETVANRLAQLADNQTPIVSAPRRPGIDRIPRVPLIGRETVLQSLTRHWTKVQSGQGQVVLLSGSAGMGKSRLLTEVNLTVRLGQGRWLRSQCQAYAALPFQPVIDLLTQILPDLDPADRATLPPELARLLFTENKKNEQRDQGDTSEVLARHRLFNGCCQLLQRAAHRQPLLVTIEDIHYADPTTLDLLHFLAQECNQVAILLVLTYQPESVTAGSPLDRLCQDLAGSGTAQVVSLAPLDRSQVATFLLLALGKDAPGWLIDSFFQATGGNPLFIEETLKTLAGEGRLSDWISTERSGQWVGPGGLGLQLPDSVLVLAERRLQFLSTEDRAILTAAAVLGSEFTFALLGGITQVDEEALLDTIERLLAAHLIEELPLDAGDDRYRFAQEPLRQALLNGLSQRRQRLLHRRAGESIEALYDTSQSRHWPILAYHWGQARDPDKAIEYLQKAGEQARRSYAYQEAIIYLNQAIDLLQSQPDTPERAHRELELQVALSSSLLTQEWGGPTAVKVHDRIQELSRQVEETPQLVEILFGLARFYFTKGQFDTTRELANRLLVAAEDRGDSDSLLAAHYMLALLTFFSGEFQAAMEHYRQVFAYYDLEKQASYAVRYGYDPKVAFLDYEPLTLWILGYPDQALAKGRNGIEFAQTLPHAHSQAHALSYASAFYQVCQNIAATKTLSEQAIALCAEHGYPVLHAYAMITHGWAVLKQGEQEAGLAEIRQGLADFWATDSLLWQPYFQAVLAEVFGQTDQIEAGLDNVNEALTMADRTRLVFWNAELYRLRGNLLWRQGELSAAEASYQQAIESARSQQARMLELRATLDLCRLWQQQGRGETGRQMLADIANWFSEGFDTPDLRQAKSLLETFV